MIFFALRVPRSRQIGERRHKKTREIYGNHFHEIALTISTIPRNKETFLYFWPDLRQARRRGEKDIGIILSLLEHKCRWQW